MAGGEHFSAQGNGTFIAQKCHHDSGADEGFGAPLIGWLTECSASGSLLLSDLFSFALEGQRRVRDAPRSLDDVDSRRFRLCGGRGDDHTIGLYRRTIIPVNSENRSDRLVRDDRERQALFTLLPRSAQRISRVGEALSCDPVGLLRGAGNFGTETTRRTKKANNR